MGVARVEVAGYQEPQVVPALVIQFTTNMPAGDKVLKAVRNNGERLCKFSDVAGVRAHNRFWNPPYEPQYDPNDPPLSKRRKFDAQGDARPKHTTAWTAKSREWKIPSERVRAS